MKLELIPTLQYMDGTEAMTLKASSICCQLLDSYAAHNMIETVLTTLTKLYCRSLTHISQQVRAGVCKCDMCYDRCLYCLHRGCIVILILIFITDRSITELANYRCQEVHTADRAD